MWTLLADDHPTRSDHEVIEWELGVDRLEEADHQRIVKSNLAATTENDPDAAETLSMELTKERAQPDAQCTDDDVEQVAAYSQEALSGVLDPTGLKIRISA